jgi:5'-3' exonuclease
MNPRKWLLVDAGNLVSLTRHSKFPADEDLPDTAGPWLAAVAEKLWFITEDLGAEGFVLAMDAKPYDRCAIYPGYKRWREPDCERALALWPTVTQALLACGAPIARITGYEAEDHIARLCQRYGTPLNEPSMFSQFSPIVVSSDKDLLQLYKRWSNVSIWTPYHWRWSARPPAIEELAKAIGEPPWELWARYRALVGDNSDCLAGCSVSEKSALELLSGRPIRGAKTLEELLAKPYRHKKVDELALANGTPEDRLPKTNRDVFERNLKLMALLGPDALPTPPLPRIPDQPMDRIAVLSALQGRPFVPPPRFDPEQLRKTVPIQPEGGSWETPDPAEQGSNGTAREAKAAPPDRILDERARQILAEEIPF